MLCTPEFCAYGSKCILRLIGMCYISQMLIIVWHWGTDIYEKIIELFVFEAKLL